MKKLFCAVWVSLASVGAMAQATEGAKFMRFTMGTDPIVQVGFATSELCRAYDEASKKQVAEGAPMNGIKFNCSDTSVASMLPYEGVLRDELFGEAVVVSSKTELRCLNTLAELLKIKDPNFGRPVFTSVAACKLKN
ncbi:hypothetical protein [Variovorax sp. OV084]|jgi:hypothetical protein|uniref:hypothetical protein n=1 Tax=Variovorax sp. OV084 TaxID=1882777 RepID=UPI0008AEA652|nr:hypothetical protein [Variovorax sp. OV084]SET78001.1 hypothetical protein SAMN05443580_106269 [Variovorax sp. OV084]